MLLSFEATQYIYLAKKLREKLGDGQTDPRGEIRVPNCHTFALWSICEVVQLVSFVQENVEGQGYLTSLQLV